MTEENKNEEVQENVEELEKTESAVVGEEREELSDDDRKKLIDAYNEQNKDSYMEYDKPTKEEIEEVANEYKEKVEEFNAIKFTIADSSNALRVSKFLKRWNEDFCVWDGEGWRGSIFFDAIIKQFIEECQKEEKDLVVDWQTLTYLYMYMRTTQGVGLKAAVKFAEIAEEFYKILDVVGDEFTRHNEEGEKIKKLQERWQCYEAGFKVFYKEEEADGTELFDPTINEEEVKEEVDEEVKND